MLSSMLVSLCVSKQDYAKTTRPILTKFDGKMTHGPRKKRLISVGNPDLDPDPGIFEGILPLRNWQW